MSDPAPAWTEQNSRTFIDIADVAVPDRREQLGAILSLIPADVSDGFTVVDVCCGDGRLSEAVLERYPRSEVLALDGSEIMLSVASKRLARYGGRAMVRAFALDVGGWTEELPSPLRCVVSSLGIHHLDEGQKRDLFSRLARRIEPGGAILIADIVAPVSEHIKSAHNEIWHRCARRQSEELTGSLATYDRAVDEGWAYYAVEDDEVDKPSPLFDQLKWLEEAGLTIVDCFWMRAGFAVYGGYR